MKRVLDDLVRLHLDNLFHRLKTEGSKHDEHAIKMSSANLRH